MNIISSSTNEYSEKTTSDDVLSKYGKYGENKAVIITGGNTGLGLETAISLCKIGADVTITCRSDDIGSSTIEAIKKACGDGVKISFGVCDLGDLSSVKSFFNSYNSSNKKCDILINNAGIMALPFNKTKQNLESQFGVNHIGHFYLTKLFLPLLSASGTSESKSRVINVSSVANYVFGPPQGILEDDINADQKYDKWQRYGHSKLANILFSNELNKKCSEEGLNVVSSSLHPGTILETDLLRNNKNTASILLEFIAFNWHSPRKLFTILFYGMKNIKQGAATQVLMALDPNFQPGKWYVDCKVTTDYLHPMAFDDNLAKKLWSLSENILKEKGF